MKTLLLASLMIQLSSAATLKVLNVESSSGSLELESVLRSSSSEKLSYVVKGPEGETVTTQTKVLPVNLLILVDTSALCQAFKMDKYLNDLLAKLPALLNPETLVSVATYSQESKSVLLSNSSVGSLENVQIECQEGALSTSYDAAISQFLSQKEKNNLATEVWVFSSGNIVLSASTLKSLTERNVRLNLSLYVPMVFSELQPMLTAQAKSLGDSFSYSIIKNEAKGSEKVSVLIPELQLTSRFTPSVAIQGTNSAFRLEAVKGGKEGGTLASTNFQALVTKSWLSILSEPVFKIILLAALIYLLYRLIRSYQPRVCNTCHRTLRFENSECRFCHDTRDATLVITENLERANLAPELTALSLQGASSTLYLSRYGISLKGSKNQALFKIEKREQRGQVAYAVVPILKPFLNGRLLKSPSFLATGDKLQMGTFTLNFLAASQGEKV